MGVADGTIGYLADEFGAPFNQIPTEMFWCYRSGLGWGALCGAIPPAACMLAMADGTDTQMELTDELMAWYQKHPFPEYQRGDGDLPQVVINSTLCHTSVTKWMVEAGIEDRGAPERSDRCAGVSADTAKKAVEILNARLEGTFEPEFEKPLAGSSVDGCMDCHSSAETSGGYPAHGSEDCVECHTEGADYTDYPHD